MSTSLDPLNGLLHPIALQVLLENGYNENMEALALLIENEPALISIALDIPLAFVFPVVFGDVIQNSGLLTSYSSEEDGCSAAATASTSTSTSTSSSLSSDFSLDRIEGMSSNLREALLRNGFGDPMMQQAFYALLSIEPVTDAAALLGGVKGFEMVSLFLKNKEVVTKSPSKCKTKELCETLSPERSKPGLKYVQPPPLPDVSETLMHRLVSNGSIVDEQIQVKYESEKPNIGKFLKVVRCAEKLGCISADDRRAFQRELLNKSSRLSDDDIMALIFMKSKPLLDAAKDEKKLSSTDESYNEENGQELELFYNMSSLMTTNPMLMTRNPSIASNSSVISNLTATSSPYGRMQVSYVPGYMLIVHDRQNCSELSNVEEVVASYLRPSSSSILPFSDRFSYQSVEVGRDADAIMKKIQFLDPKYDVVHVCQDVHVVKGLVSLSDIHCAKKCIVLNRACSLCPLEDLCGENDGCQGFRGVVVGWLTDVDADTRHLFAEYFHGHLLKQISSTDGDETGAYMAAFEAARKDMKIANNIDLTVDPRGRRFKAQYLRMTQNERKMGVVSGTVACAGIPVFMNRASPSIASELFRISLHGSSIPIDALKLTDAEYITLTGKTFSFYDTYRLTVLKNKVSIYDELVYSTQKAKGELFPDIELIFDVLYQRLKKHGLYLPTTNDIFMSMFDYLNVFHNLSCICFPKALYEKFNAIRGLRNKFHHGRKDDIGPVEVFMDGNELREILCATFDFIKLYFGFPNESVNPEYSMYYQSISLGLGVPQYPDPIAYINVIKEMLSSRDELSNMGPHIQVSTLRSVTASLLCENIPACKVLDDKGVVEISDFEAVEAEVHKICDDIYTASNDKKEAYFASRNRVSISFLRKYLPAGDCCTVQNLLKTYLCGDTMFKTYEHMTTGEVFVKKISGKDSPPPPGVNSDPTLVLSLLSELAFSTSRNADDLNSSASSSTTIARLASRNIADFSGGQSYYDKQG